VRGRGVVPLALERAGAPSVHALGFAGVAFSLLAAALVLPLDAPPLSLFACPFRAATGLPCLTCGCTHAFHFFIRGRLGDAVAASPLGAALALLCAAHLLWTCARLAGLPFAPRARVPRWLLVSAVAANWMFLVLRSRA
jgi:hypothetical protein